MKNLLKKIVKSTLHGVLACSGFKNIVLYDHFNRDNIYIRCASYLDTNRVEGDCLHFGVGGGNDFVAFYKCMKQCTKFYRHFYLFDSFKGLPEPKDTLNGKYRAGKYTFTKKNLLSRFGREKVSQSDYTITEGYFNDTLTADLREKLSLKKAALVLLDCDLYESTMDALKFVRPYLQEGTIILAGEYFNYRANPEKGMASAISSFFDKDKDKLIKWRPYGDSGMAFICSSKKP